MSVRSVVRPRATAIGQRVLVHGMGRATASHRVLPNVLIVGGQRCGTTSMYRALAQHPATFKATLHKGVHYFDTNYERGIDWYRGHFPLQSTVSRTRDRLQLEPVVFESSPYYGFHPLAAGRLNADLPGVRLLVLIRDPVERAYSAHAHELARGYETEPFERTLELETSRLAGEEQRMLEDPYYVSHAHQHQAYLHRGRYIELLRRLASVVGRERLHVVDSHQFFSRPESAFTGVLDFLGLSATPDIRFERHNARERAALDPKLRRRLEEHFAPYDADLAEWLGWQPSWRS